MEQEQEYHNNWDLQAVVRGYRPPLSPLPPAPAKNPFESFPSLPVVVKEEDKDSILSFPDLMATPSGLHELEELCKCFLAKSTGPTCQTQVRPVQLVQPVQRNKPHRPPVQTPRSKRRKNQQKKVVCHVPAGGVSSDMWAWRKYGQKPIKGSPHPRGYYRCSSSKGCLARKQVERSSTDPGMFIITYTAEHNHPVPSHRNSLAGSTRQKLATTSAGGGGSPTTPLIASMEDELLHGEIVNEEEGVEGGLGIEDVEMCREDEFLILGQDGEDGNGCVQFEKIGNDFSELLDESCFNPPPGLVRGGRNHTTAVTGAAVS